MVILQSFEHFEFFFFDFPIHLNFLKFTINFTVFLVEEIFIFFIVDNIKYFKDNCLLFAIFFNFLQTLLFRFIFSLQKLLRVCRLILFSQILLKLQSFVFLFKFDFLLFKFSDFWSHWWLLYFEQILVNIKWFSSINWCSSNISLPWTIILWLSSFIRFFWQFV